MFVYTLTLSFHLRMWKYKEKWTSLVLSAKKKIEKRSMIDEW